MYYTIIAFGGGWACFEVVSIIYLFLNKSPVGLCDSCHRIQGLLSVNAGSAAPGYSKCR